MADCRRGVAVCQVRKPRGQLHAAGVVAGITVKSFPSADEKIGVFPGPEMQSGRFQLLFPHELRIFVNPNDQGNPPCFQSIKNHRRRVFGQAGGNDLESAEGLGLFAS